MNSIKDLSLLSISLLFCYILLIIADWYLQSYISKSNRDQIEIEQSRITNEDIPQREQAILDGFSPTILPGLFDTFSEDFKNPLIAGLPRTKTYFCNEGYGLIKYKSDRFGFRNKDSLWDENPKNIMIGDSFVHGACVTNENTLPNNLSELLKSNIINLGMGGNNPSHYLTYAHLFIPKIKPNIVYLNFYPNDYMSISKSAIERKYVDEKIKIFSQKNIAFYDSEIFLKEGKALMENLKSEGDIFNKSKFFNIIQKFYKAFRRHYALPYISSLIYKYNGNFFPTERAVTQTLRLCALYDCHLIVSFIPNNKYSRPDYRADFFGDEIKKLTDKLKIPFVDGRKHLNREKNSPDFAIKGGHLSPLGYEKMAQAIVNITKKISWN